MSTEKYPQIVDFDAADLIGGIINDGKKPGEEVGLGVQIEGAFVPYKYMRRTIQTLCVPVYSIIKAIGNPTIHYFRYVHNSFYIKISKLIIIKILRARANFFVTKFKTG